MISKLIVHADTREEAIQELYNALNDYKVVGLPTNIKFLKRVLLNEEFKDWDFDTSFIAKNEEELLGARTVEQQTIESKAHVAIATAWLEHQLKLEDQTDAANPWNAFDNFRLNSPSLRMVNVVQHGDAESSASQILLQYHSGNKFTAVFRENPTDGDTTPIIENVEVSFNPEDDSELILKTDDKQFKMGYLIKADDGTLSADGTTESKVVLLDSEGQQLGIRVESEVSIGQSDSSGDSLTKSDFVKSPMPGTVAKVFVSEGQEIKEGDSLISIESMKMEYLIRATHDAKIQEVRAAESQFVQIGERLIIFEKEEELAA